MKLLFVAVAAPLLIFDSASAQLLPFTQYDLDQVSKSQNFRDAQSASIPQCGDSSISPTDSDSVFFIGDSITVGMIDGGLLEATKELGFSVSTEYKKLPARNVKGTPRRKGPSVEAIGAYQSTNIQPYLSEHATDYAAAETIVVALGTNRGINTPQETMINYTTEFVDVLRSNNPIARIIWVNVYRRDGREGNINAAIAEAGVRKNFTVLDFSSVARADQESYPLADLVHHTSIGNKNKSSWVLEQIANPSANISANSPTSTCGDESLTGDNEADVFRILVNEYGYTREQAAGVIANMRHESSVEPMRLQGTPRGVETPSATVNISATKGIGWGLVQWTPTGKIIEQSFIRDVPYQEIDTLSYQLKFLTGQLRGEDIGGEVSNEKSRAGDPFFASTTVEEAARIFAVDYERCAACQNGSGEVQDRINEAVEILIKLGSS